MPMSPNEMFRGLRGRFNRRRKDDYLFLSNPNLPFGYLDRAEADNDDTCSISSHSTTSTIDDNPGTGRILDKCFYQPLARKFERFIFRMKLSGLPPARIYAFFERILGPGEDIYHADRNNLRDCVEYYDKDKDVQNSIYGLKSLVKQTQSSSLYQSAAALTSLFHISTLCKDTSSFYKVLSRTEPIFHVETLVSTLDDSHLMKKYTFLLVSLAKAHVIAIQDFQLPKDFPSLAGVPLGHEHPLQFPEQRQYFLRLLGAIPNKAIGADLFAPIAEACHLYARSLSCMHWRRGGFDLHIMEIIYFMLIFFLQSIHVLYYEARLLDPTTYQFIHMVLSAVSNWLDNSLMKCIGRASNLRSVTNKLLSCGTSFRGLLLAIPMARVLLPKSCRMIDHYPLIYHKYLPRRLRTECVGQCVTIEMWLECPNSRKNPAMIEALIQSSMSKSARIFKSFTELKHDLRHTSTDKYTPVDMDGIVIAVIRKVFLVKRTFIKASRVQVNVDEATRDFRRALADERVWEDYITVLHKRKEGASFFLYDLDWDWDVAGSLEQLYALDEPTLSADSHVVHVYTEGDGADTWNMKASTHMKLPKEVRIPYMTEAGELAYRTYSCNPDLVKVPTEERAPASVQDDGQEEQGPEVISEADVTPVLNVFGGTSLAIRSAQEEMDDESGDDATTALGSSSETDESKYTTHACVSEEASSERPMSLSGQVDDLETREFAGATEVNIFADGNSPSGSLCFTKEMDGGEGDIATTSSETSFDIGSPPNSRSGAFIHQSKLETPVLLDVPCAGGRFDNQAFIEELTAEADGEDTASEMSIESTQGSSKNDMTSSFAQQVIFTVGTPENHAFIEELDAEEDVDATESRMSAKYTPGSIDLSQRVLLLSRSNMRM